MVWNARYRHTCPKTNEVTEVSEIEKKDIPKCPDCGEEYAILPVGLSHYVYILRCGDGSLYTGYTTDTERRLREHRQSDGAKYTRGRGPLEMVHTEEFNSRSNAMAREYEIKQLSKSEKESLIID